MNVRQNHIVPDSPRSYIIITKVVTQCMVQEIQRAGKGIAAKTPWFIKAVREGTFTMVYTVIQLATVVCCHAVPCCAVL